MASTMAEGQNADCKQPEKRAQEVERVQADESRQAKISQAHSAEDAVFIAVSNDEATQAKEKINREEGIGAGKPLLQVWWQVVKHDEDSCKSAKTIQQVEAMRTGSMCAA